MWLGTSRRLGIVFALLAAGILAMLSFGVVRSQTVTTLEYGTAVVGSIPTEGDQVVYGFNGSPGDVVMVRAVAVTPGMTVTVTLFGPAQQLLTTSVNVAGLPVPDAPQLVFRLQEAGPHYLVVTGTPGDFVLILEGRPAATFTVLDLDTPVELNLPAAEPSQTLTFNTDPFAPTTLLIDAQPAAANVYIEVRDGGGQVVALLRDDLDNACLSLGPGDELHDVMVLAGDEQTTATVTLTLSHAPCDLGEPVTETTVATPQFLPVPIEGVCAASSATSVNIRSGPGTVFNVVALLPARQAIQVVGVNDDGRWYVVQNAGVQGWIAASVVAVVGPCDNLPVAPLPQPPAASPTPGLPLVTVTPLATATPSGAASPTPTVMAETPTPGDVTATVEPTVEATETVVPPTATPEGTETAAPGG
ncbi:MAG: SH3 domain-containing protein [Chloroflexi bacterium]|nr:SH3 domain-containing protein [Chloroflexota bacterium]